jgi:hypothetical protein
VIFAVVKASARGLRSPDVVGGICGTAFAIAPAVALTANHVLNDATFRPNASYALSWVWLIARDGSAHRVTPQMVTPYEEVDTAVIELASPGFPEVLLRAGSSTSLDQGIAVRSSGYAGLTTHGLHFEWSGGDLVPSVTPDHSLSFRDRAGYVRAVRTAAIRAADIRMSDTRLLELSYGGNVGMSGGPLIYADSVVGLMSVGLPPDVPEKHTLFAVAMADISSAISGRRA